MSDREPKLVQKNSGGVFTLPVSGDNLRRTPTTPREALPPTSPRTSSSSRGVTPVKPASSGTSGVPSPPNITPRTDLKSIAAPPLALARPRPSPSQHGHSPRGGPRTGSSLGGASQFFWNRKGSLSASVASSSSRVSDSSSRSARTKGMGPYATSRALADGPGGTVDSDDGSSGPASPVEQEAAARPVLFHRVEHWLNDKAFALETDDFCVRTEGSLGAERRPMTASSPGFATRYRRTVASYAQQNAHLSGAGGGVDARAGPPLAATDDAGFESLLTRLAVAHDEDHAMVSPARTRAGQKGNGEDPRVSNSSGSGRHTSHQRACERLWRARLRDRGMGDSSDSSWSGDGSDGDDV